MVAESTDGQIAPHPGGSSRCGPTPLRAHRTLLVPAFFLLLAGAFLAPALLTGRVLLPTDALFLYQPWRSFAAQFGVTVPHNHLIADTILQNYSWKALAAQAYAAGQLPLWNPYILAGQPFLAAGQNASLYPAGLLYALLPQGRAYAPFIALHLALAGGLTYWLVRVLGGCRFGGLVGGVTFAFSGYLVVSILWPMVVSTAAWLPGLLAVVELVVRRSVMPGSEEGRESRRPAWARDTVPLVLVGAGIVMLQFLAGHLEMSLYLLLTAGAYAALRLVMYVGAGQKPLAWRWWRALSGKSARVTRHAGEAGPASTTSPGASPTRSRSRPVRALAAGALLLGMVALGSLGAGVQLAPFAEVISWNVRGGQVSYEDVRGYALARQQLASFVVPDFFGNPSHHAVFDLWQGGSRALDGPLGSEPAPRWGTEWGPKNYVEGTAYVGILPLLLCLVALLARRDAPTRALAILALLCLLLAFGTPLYGLLFFGLPGVNQLHTPFRWVYPYSLCAAVLAGLGASAVWRRGAEALERARAEARARAHPLPLPLPAGGGESLAVVYRPSGPATAVIVLSLLLGLLGLVALAAGWVLQDSLLAVATRAMARSSALEAAFGDARALYSYEWGNLVGLALLLLASGLALLALARRAPGARALVLGLLVADLFSFGGGFNTAGNPAALTFVPPSIAAIKADTDLFRIATLGEDDVLPANTNMLFGLQDIRGYDTVILRDVVGYLELIEPQRGLLYSKVDKLFRPASLDSPLLDLLNVKYVLTTQRLDRPGWRLAYDGDVSSAPGDGLRVYRNERVLPRATLVEYAVGAADAAESLSMLGRPGFDPRREVVLEGFDPPPPTVQRPGFGFEGPVGPAPQVTDYQLNRVVVVALALRPAYLVLSDVNVTGWTVRVNGQEQPLLRANRIFRAVRLPPGQHEVVFEYRPLSFRLGLVLTGLAFGLGLLALGVWGYLRLLHGAVGAAGPVGRVLKNSLFPLMTGLLNRAFDFGFALIYLRLLGPPGAGAYAFAVVIVGYFDILVNFGLSTLITREVARRPAESDRYFATVLAARLLLALTVLLAALALAGPLAGPLQIEPEVGLAIVLLTLGMLPGSLGSTASALFMARERMEVPAAVTVLSTLARIGLGTAALLAGWGIVGLAAVSLVVNLLNAIVLGGLMVILLGRPRPRVEPAFGRALLILSWPLMLNSFLNSLFFRIDAVLLKPLAGEVALGHYSTAYKFIDGLQIIPSTFVLALFPVLARQADDDRAALARVFGLGLKVLLVLALPISVGTTLLASPIIGLFAGPAYLPDSALALQVLIWFLPFSFVNGLTQYVLIALNRQRWITLSFFVGAVVNLALNLFAIPRYGFLGAAAVTVISEWVLFIPFWRVARRDLPDGGPLEPRALLELIWRPALASAVMGIAVAWARDVNPWLAIPIGAGVYGASLLALGGMTRAELQALRRRS